MTTAPPSLLLLSSSKYRDTGYLTHARDTIRAFLPDGLDHVLFVPFANVTDGYDAFEAKTAEALEPAGIAVRSIHHAADPAAAVAAAGAVAVGGGNTFVLLARVREMGLLAALGAAVAGGTPYVGWSAGSNLACPTIRTTNDMPIRDPGGFQALGLIPFQLNPHFIAGKVQGHNGESREERLAEFLALNPGERVLALPEGTALERRGATLTLHGAAEALLFTAAGTRTLPRGEDPSWLLAADGET
ncbi:MAG: dipeptidase PepE [Hyphomicrobiales bacterium]|nr:dipeptidase PepE [Hyphomicrobiales bacterium]